MKDGNEIPKKGDTRSYVVQTSEGRRISEFDHESGLWRDQEGKILPDALSWNDKALVEVDVAVEKDMNASNSHPEAGDDRFYMLHTPIGPRSGHYDHASNNWIDPNGDPIHKVDIWYNTPIEVHPNEENPVKKIMKNMEDGEEEKIGHDTIDFVDASLFLPPNNTDDWFHTISHGTMQPGYFVNGAWKNLRSESIDVQKWAYHYPVVIPLSDIDSELNEILREATDDTLQAKQRVTKIESRRDFCKEHQFREEERIANVELSGLQQVAYQYTATVNKIKKLLETYDS